jgi:hypothetical protein
MSCGVGAEPRNIFLEDNVHRGGDAACSGVVDPIIKRLGRIANENATESFRIQLTALVVRVLNRAHC